ncbi:hypothetical protein KFV02_11225 [Desulfohalobiaceae bacterium Ax17]|uniref:hypothetical protein n=1 Tax=Desulfovulcanus ferrireducens TaxID=2831190 RepID=UPI00207BAAF1|nr:hypothetical protein [Desulfovulcanus ferrireducens]MBT8764504.1 hypothetical protein [Desulfovulcanus ferrireducens]
MIFEYDMALGFIVPLGVMVVLSSLGASIMAWCSELFGMWQKKIFLDKFAWQMSRLATIVILALVLIAFFLSVYAKFYPPLSIFYKQNQDVLWPGIICLGLAAIFLFSYWSTWKKLKKNKVLHLILGIIGIGCLKIFFISLILVFYYQSLGLTPKFLPPSLDSLIYPITSQLFILSLVAAASFGFLYLVLRRFKDDFGRDYYRYSLNLTAKWNIFSLLFSFLPCIWVYVLLRDKLKIIELYLPAATIVLCTVLIIILCSILIKSIQPLRLKGVMICCLILVWIIFVARLISYMELANLAQDNIRFHPFTREWISMF